MAKGKFLLARTAQDAFSEAYRYYENGKEILRHTPIEYGIYREPKHVKEAAAMGYLAALRAIDGYLLSPGILPDRLPTSIVAYEKALQKIPRNGKLMASLTVVYQNLHTFGYYRGGIEVEMIKAGFKHAKVLIDTLAATQNSGEKKNQILDRRLYTF